MKKYFQNQIFLTRERRGHLPDTGWRGRARRNGHAGHRGQPRVVGLLVRGGEVEEDEKVAADAAEGDS